MKINRHRTRQTVSILIVLLFTSGVAAYAQSGRRSTSKPAPPAPPVSTSETVPVRQPEASKLQLLVTVEDPSSFSNVPSFYSYTVLDACMERLGDASGVHATASPRMNRAQALKAAKAEKERFVVWLEVGDELMDSAPQVRNNSTKLYVNYTIFEPVTGKIRKSGRTSQGSFKVGNVGISGPASRNAVYSEYEVKQSAREAAEKILAAFQIRLTEGGRWPLD